MAGLNAAGIQMAYGAIAQAWEDSSPLLVITEASASAPAGTRIRHGRGVQAGHQMGRRIDRADLVPDYMRRAFTHLRSGRPARCC